MPAALVSVVIPTYNRFSQLCAAVESVRRQTYKNIEIIVVNDCSTEAAYYENKIPGATVIHLRENTRRIFGFPCAGYVRNMGAKLASGEYIAFLDDDDEWLPQKIEMQIATIGEYEMSCTEAYFCAGAPPPPPPPPPLYNGHHYKQELKHILDLPGDELPDIFTYDIIKKHNCIITSSVLVLKHLFMKYGGFNYLRNGEEDYNLWLTLIKETNCVYLKEPLLKYNYSFIAGKHA